MSFRADLKRMLGSPLMDVELEDPQDYVLIEKRVLNIIKDYLPVEHVVRKTTPSGSYYGEGYVDIASDGFLAVTDKIILRSPKRDS